MAFRILTSAGRLVSILGTEAGRFLIALACFRPATAATHLRRLCEALHEDMLQALVALQRVLPIWRNPPPTIDRILIIKLDRIGDMVTTTPVFDALRQAYPQARLDIVGHPGPLSLLKGDDRIGERMPYKSWMYHPVAILPGGPRLWMLLAKLLWRRYPLVVYLRGSLPWLWLVFFSRVAATKFVLGEPVITRYLRALEPVLGSVPRYRTRLHVDPDAAEFARQLFSDGDADSQPVIVIHPAASSAAKMWPAERFAELADALVEQFGAQVNFVGAMEDAPVLARIQSLVRREHRRHTQLTLPQVVALISRADLFIGNDSGLSHIAAAVRTKLIVLWGPVNLSMARPDAPDERCVILYHELSCRAACPELSCTNPIAFECLSRTRTEDVVASARRLLRGDMVLPVLQASNPSI